MKTSDDKFLPAHTLRPFLLHPPYTSLVVASASLSVTSSAVILLQTHHNQLPASLSVRKKWRRGRPYGYYFNLRRNVRGRGLNFTLL